MQPGLAGNNLFLLLKEEEEEKERERRGGKERDRETEREHQRLLIRDLVSRSKKNRPWPPLPGRLWDSHRAQDQAIKATSPVQRVANQIRAGLGSQAKPEASHLWPLPLASKLLRNLACHRAV